MRDEGDTYTEEYVFEYGSEVVDGELVLIPLSPDAIAHQAHLYDEAMRGPASDLP